MREITESQVWEARRCAYGESEDSMNSEGELCYENMRHHADVDSSCNIIGNYQLFIPTHLI